MEKRIITFLSFEELPPEKQIEKAKQWRGMYEENFLFEDALCNVTRGMNCIPLPDAWKDEDGSIVGCPDFKWEEVAEIVRCQRDVYNPRQNKTEKGTFIQFQTPWYGSHNVRVKILDLYYHDFLVPTGTTKRQFDDFDFLHILGFPKEYKQYFDQLSLKDDRHAYHSGNDLINIQLDGSIEEDMESEDPAVAAEAKRLMDGFPEALFKVKLNFDAWISFLEKDLSDFFKDFYEKTDDELIEIYKEHMDLSEHRFFENGDFVPCDIYKKTECHKEYKMDAELSSNLIPLGIAFQILKENKKNVFTLDNERIHVHLSTPVGGDGEKSFAHFAWKHKTSIYSKEIAEGMNKCVSIDGDKVTMIDVDGEVFTILIPGISDKE